MSAPIAADALHPPDEPFWSAKVNDRYPGRFPLSVERHVFRQVDRLAVGFTTVTPHARYYLLHTLLAAEATRLNWTAEERVERLRRAEVVLAAVSARHRDPHPGWSRAHGAAVIATRMSAQGLDVVGAASPGMYAKAKRGFQGPYLGSELALGLVELTGGELLPGSNAAVGAIRRALGPVVELSAQDHVSIEQLDAARSLCLCGSAIEEDGALLRRLLLATDAEPSSFQHNRQETIKMLARLIELHPPERPTDLTGTLAYGDIASTEGVLKSLKATRAWQGTVLRWYAVNAWRRLWAWLVNDHINGPTSRHDLADALADVLPQQTVQAYLENLPPTMTNGQPAPAEQELDHLTDGAKQFAVAALSGQRIETLTGALALEYEDRREADQQLTPTWMRHFLDARLSHSVRDAGRDLVLVLIDRSQRIARSKASYRRDQGIYLYPTRVFTRDAFVVRDSNEGSVPVGLRWEQIVTVLAGVGVFEYRNDRWWLTDLGRESLG